MAKTDKPVSPHCMQRIRAKFLYGIVCLLFALSGLAGISRALEGPGGLKDSEQMLDLALGGGVLLIFGLAAAIFMRDALFPAKSAFARTLLSQLDFPDEAGDIRQLFREVDRDISQNGMWFDRMAVGDIWIFGDGAMKRDRVRGIFWDKTHTVRNGKSYTGYLIILVDKNGNVMETEFRLKDDWEAAWSCLTLAFPAAKRGDRSECARFERMSEEERAAFDRAFRQQAPAQAERYPQPVQDIVLTDRAGIDSSRVSPDVIRRELLALRPGEQFRLMPTVPAGGVRSLTCICEGQSYRLLAEQAKGGIHMRTASQGEALDAATAFYQQKAMAIFGQRAQRKGES